MTSLNWRAKQGEINDCRAPHLPNNCSTTPPKASMSRTSLHGFMYTARYLRFKQLSNKFLRHSRSSGAFCLQHYSGILYTSGNFCPLRFSLAGCFLIEFPSTARTDWHLSWPCDYAVGQQHSLRSKCIGLLFWYMRSPNTTIWKV